MQGGSGGNKRGGRRQEIQNIIRRGNEPSDDMINKFIATGNNQQSSNGLSAQTIGSLKQAEKVSSLTACECNHGLMVEALKKFIFSKNQK